MNKMQRLPPASIEIPPLAAKALITHVQLASRHPAVQDDQLTKMAHDCAHQLQSLFNPESATYQVLELRWNPDEDRPQEVEPSSEPGEDFKNNLGCSYTGYKTAEVTADSTFMKYPRLSFYPRRDMALPCPYTSSTWNTLYKWLGVTP